MFGNCTNFFMLLLILMMLIGKWICYFNFVPKAVYNHLKSKNTEKGLVTRF